MKFDEAEETEFEREEAISKKTDKPDYRPLLASCFKLAEVIESYEEKEKSLELLALLNKQDPLPQFSTEEDYNNFYSVILSLVKWAQDERGLVSFLEKSQPGEEFLAFIQKQKKTITEDFAYILMVINKLVDSPYQNLFIGATARSLEADYGSLIDFLSMEYKEGHDLARRLSVLCQSSFDPFAKPSRLAMVKKSSELENILERRKAASKNIKLFKSVSIEKIVEEIQTSSLSSLERYHAYHNLLKVRKGKKDRNFRQEFLEAELLTRLIDNSNLDPALIIAIKITQLLEDKKIPIEVRGKINARCKIQMADENSGCEKLMAELFSLGKLGTEIRKEFRQELGESNDYDCLSSPEINKLGLAHLRQNFVNELKVFYEKQDSSPPLKLIFIIQELAEVIASKLVKNRRFLPEKVASVVRELFESNSEMQGIVFEEEKLSSLQRWLFNPLAHEKADSRENIIQTEIFLVILNEISDRFSAIKTVLGEDGKTMASPSVVLRGD